MAYKKLSKEDEKVLRAYCSQMPTFTEDICEVHIMTGAELKEMGYVEKEGKPLVDDVKYDFKYPVVLATNHYRRLKKAWLKDGEAGLKKYFEMVKLSIDNHKKQQFEYAK
jgi:hypothetical protein